MCNFLLLFTNLFLYEYVDSFLANDLSPGWSGRVEGPRGNGNGSGYIMGMGVEMELDRNENGIR